MAGVKRILCLKGSNLKISKQLLETTISLPDINPALNQGDMAALFSSEKLNLFRIINIEQIHSSNDKTFTGWNIKGQPLKELPIHKRIINVLFANRDFLCLDLTYLEKISQFGRNLDMPDNILHIKTKKDMYVRFIFIDPAGNIFRENYINWNDWKKLENEFHDIMDNADFSIKNNRREDLIEHFSTIRDVFEKSSPGFIDLLFDKDKSRMNRSNRLSILWEDKNLYMPFEFLSGSLYIKNLVPVIDRKPGLLKKTGGFSFIYSNRLNNSREEVFNLYQLVKSHYEAECFSSDNFSDYKTGLRNAHYFHFSGHGELIGEKGLIEIEGKLLEELPFADNIGFAFLNCCKTGMFAGGITSSFLKNTSQYVIASPFEISDEQENFFSSDIEFFYGIFQPEEIELAFQLTVLNNPEFAKIYRLFGTYSV